MSDKPPRIIFVNRFFYPDHSATSQLLSDLAFYLSGHGMEVYVVTSRLTYENNEMLPAYEDISKVSVFRVWTTSFGRSNLLGRSIDYLSFYFSITLRLFSLVRRGDTVVVKTDPPLLNVPVSLVSGIKRARLINWLQDIFPEIAKAYGIKFVQGPIYTSLRALRNVSLRSAFCNVVLGDKMNELLREQGVPDDNILTIANWSDDKAITPVDLHENPLRREWGLSDKFVVCYSGNLGRVHEFETILSAASFLGEQNDIVFLFIGGGPQIEKLQAKVVELKLNNFIFRPYQARESLSYSLGVGNVHLVSLLPNMEGLVFPSKLYGILAAGKPVIFIGDSNGDISTVISQFDVGRQVDIYNGEKLRDVILELKKDDVECSRLGHNSRQLFESKFTKSLALEKWYNLLNKKEN